MKSKILLLVLLAGLSSSPVLAQSAVMSAQLTADVTAAQAGDLKAAAQAAAE